MPISLSNDILEAKALGKSANLIWIDLPSPIYWTDCAREVVFNGNTYQPDGYLQEVDSGAITAGIQSNEWDAVFSAIPQSTYTFILSQNLNNIWVHHYTAYFKDTFDAEIFVGAEENKRGQILSVTDTESADTASATITMTGPLGNLARNNPWKTNPSSHKKRFAGDTLMDTAHEVDYKIPSQGSSGSGSGGRVGGDYINTLPPREYNYQ